ncbi:zinc finger protein 850-like [Protopterus annectens]|uniref:zinc finger protein 850-like n=1 Tax=Protopterus annectens TaxID=7888 RepID=UPI001CF9AC64|nr:zinc finger protein 850-like [Protopterus annectens]
MRMYVILDDQSNRSLQVQNFLTSSTLTVNHTSYTWQTCAGQVETSGTTAYGFMIVPIYRNTQFPLSTLTECDQLPDNREEIPTPEAACHQFHLKCIADCIPPLDKCAKILILLGRDIPRVHKVHKECNGLNDAAYAQRRYLGFVVGMKSTDYNVNCSQQPALVKTQLHHPRRNLEQRSQPGKDIDEVYLTHVPHLPSEHQCHQTPECDSGTPVTHHPTEHLQLRAQTVKVYDDLPLSPTPTLHSGHGCSRSSECDTTKGFHRKTEMHKCAECSKSFTYASALKNHQAIHTGLKPYKCAECSKSFTYASALKNHQAIHTGLKPYKCTECSKCFRYPSDRRRHLVIHTGLKPHICTECGKSFVWANSLKSHQTIHTGAKPYKCTECSKCFRDRSSFRRHLVIHTRLKSHICTTCGKSFARANSLKSHQAIHTGPKVIVENCKKRGRI